MTEYAVYKGDDFIAQGTTEELAEQFNIKPSSVVFMARPANLKRDKGNRKIAVRV